MADPISLADPPLADPCVGGPPLGGTLRWRSPPGGTPGGPPLRRTTNRRPEDKRFRHGAIYTFIYIYIYVYICIYGNVPIIPIQGFVIK